MSWERPRTGGFGLGQNGIPISLSALIFWGFCGGSVLLQASFMIYSIINLLESVSGARTRICKTISVS